MEYILDSPAWHALNSGNKNLSFGNEEVRCFDREVSPFAAMRENTPANFRLLYDMLPHERGVLFMTPIEINIPAFWEVLFLIKGIQMICDKPAKANASPSALIPLTYEHVPQMIALTRLTNPGPFDTKTIEFGHYRGIFEGDKLVAMAGQRLHAYYFAEVSAVCTHPDHIGKGYARQLLLYQIDRIREASEIPYLHVKSDNDRAIKLYESLGFEKSRDMYFYVIRKVRV
ncbi:MAG TPA: GNAT family N-acetyltransferase [Flavipsychrobacter sp.]|nr:GNAT family N-acetyltransferase [Flavipsychrobacter sp.]